MLYRLENIQGNNKLGDMVLYSLEILNIIMFEVIRIKFKTLIFYYYMQNI